MADDVTDDLCCQYGTLVLICLAQALTRQESPWNLPIALDEPWKGAWGSHMTTYSIYTVHIHTFYVEQILQQYGRLTKSFQSLNLVIRRYYSIFL